MGGSWSVEKAWRSPGRAAAIVFALLLLAAGCEQEPDTPLPDSLVGQHKLTDILLADTDAQLWIPTDEPDVRPTEVQLYFPRRHPSDPTLATVNIRLLLTDYINTRPETPTLLDSIPQDMILAAPANTPMSFDQSNFLFRSTLYPMGEGHYRASISWQSEGILDSATARLYFSRRDPGNLNLLYGSWRDLGHLVWLHPEDPGTGPQEVACLAWRGTDGGQRTDPDTSLSIRLHSQLADGTVVDSVWLDRLEHRYTGTLIFPQGTGWTVRARVLRDTTLVGTGVFPFGEESITPD